LKFSIQIISTTTHRYQSYCLVTHIAVKILQNELTSLTPFQLTK